MDEIQVTVVVIVLNNVLHIGRCIEALLLQTYPRDQYEILIVDNGSIDGTYEKALQYPVRVCRELKRGYSPARNAGVANAKGKVIAFTDSDCIAENNWLEVLIAPYQLDDVGVTGGKILPLRNETMVEQFIDEAGFVKRKEKISNVLDFTTANVSFRLECLRAIGGFDNSLPSCEDIDAVRKVQLIVGKRAVYVESAIVYHQNYSDFKGLAKLSRRNGYGEIIMATRWQTYEAFSTNIFCELRYYFRQWVALFVYICSFVKRLFLFSFKRIDHYQLLFPIMWFWSEINTILGKTSALWDTRFMKEWLLSRNQHENFDA
jgi:glycosyltransferase involved in cell wall biosynthesis